MAIQLIKTKCADVTIIAVENFIAGWCFILGLVGGLNQHEHNLWRLSDGVVFNTCIGASLGGIFAGFGCAFHRLWTRVPKYAAKPEARICNMECN